MARLPGGRARDGDRPPARPGARRGLARRLVEVDPHGPPARPQEAALDRRVDRLGARAAAARRRRHRPLDLRADDEHHRQAPHGHRPGRRAGRRAARSAEPQAAGRPDEPTGVRRPPARPRAPRSSRFCEELRGEGVAVGTSELLDAFAALEAVPWTDPADFREALAATIAKSQEDRRVFELLFERYFFRAAEAEALEREVREERRYDGGERLDLEQLREAIRQAIAEGSDGEMRDAGPARDRRLRPPRRGLRAWSASTCSGSAARSGCRSAGASEEGEGPPLDREQIHALRAPPAPRARAGADRADREAAPVAPAGRARPRPAHEPDARTSPRSTARSPS